MGYHNAMTPPPPHLYAVSVILIGEELPDRLAIRNLLWVDRAQSGDEAAGMATKQAMDKWPCFAVKGVRVNGPHLV